MLLNSKSPVSVNAAPADPLDSRTTELSGTVQKVVFHNPDNGFCVLSLAVQGAPVPVTVVGHAAHIKAQEQVQCHGRWVNDRQRGRQFQAERLAVLPPSTREGVHRYLASGMIKGIGRHFADLLVESYGDQVFHVIENEPQRLLELPGFGKKRLEQVVRGWRQQRAVQDIMLFLQSHGIGTARAVRIYKIYGKDAIARITDNPYQLALDVPGFGFKTADELALKLGMARDALHRARAGVRHVLDQQSVAGHCAVAQDELTAMTARLLEVDPQRVAEALELEVKSGRVIRENTADAPVVFLTPLYRAEIAIAKHIERLQKHRAPWQEVDVPAAIPWVERQTGLTLSESQRQAVATVLSAKVAVITGGPGVGKTTLVNSILRLVSAKNVDITLCAPTGRAAKRLSESTGRPAKTIHRLLEFDPYMNDFSRSDSDPLDTDLVVVDESSMVDVLLMERLVQALPDRCGLLLVGDVDQLPSVGPGAVLHDLIASEAVVTARLTEIFRQSRQSAIILNAHRINHGEMPVNDGELAEPADFYFIASSSNEVIAQKLLEVVTERIPQRFGFDPRRDVQVLTPMNRGELGVRSLNGALQARINPHGEPRVERFGWTFAVGDKVLQTVNNYDKEVFNGDIGHIVHVDMKDEQLRIDFDGRRVSYGFNELEQLSLAYAVTIHKSQGSEYPAVVIPLSMQHYTMLERNLLYTAVTRGKQLVVVIGQQRALALAVQRTRSGLRNTRLAQRLRRAVNDGGASARAGEAAHG